MSAYALYLQTLYSSEKQEKGDGGIERLRINIQWENVANPCKDSIPCRYEPTFRDTVVLCQIPQDILLSPFNAMTKLFRANLHGVADRKFFFFRIAKIYAYPH